jgi:hypothetical protein
MTKLNEKDVNLLKAVNGLCEVVIDEAKEHPTKINQLRICEANNVRAIARALMETGHQTPPEEYEKTVEELCQRIRSLHQNPQSVGKHDHLLKEEGKG